MVRNFNISKIRKLRHHKCVVKCGDFDVQKCGSSKLVLVYRSCQPFCILGSVHYLGGPFLFVTNQINSLSLSWPSGKWMTRGQNYFRVCSELISALASLETRTKKPTRLLSFTWGHPSEKEGKFLTYQLNPIDFLTVTFQPKKLKRLEKTNWASDKTWGGWRENKNAPRKFDWEFWIS